MSSLAFSPLIDKAIYHVRTQAYASIDFAKHSEHLSLSERLELAFEWDYKDEFVNLVKGLSYKDDVEPNTWLCMYGTDAVNCVTAILSGETHGKLSLQDTLYLLDSPLHGAALASSIKIMKLFLDRGESADARAEETLFTRIFKDELPLNVAMRAVFRFDKWRFWGSPQKSPFWVLVLLCDRPKHKEFEVVRLLARVTKELDQEFLKYMKAEAIPELCVLLLVGYRLPPTSLLRLGDEVPGGRKEVILELLKIFDTIGDKLSAYVRIKRSHHVTEDKVVAEMFSIFQDGGLPIKCKDTQQGVPLQRRPGEEPSPTFHEETRTLLQKLAGPGLALAQASGGISTQGVGVRSFHSSTFPKTGRLLVKGVQSVGFRREYVFLATALRRVGKLL